MDESLIEAYLKEYNGSLAKYKEGRYQGYRLGQAFFNALSQFDRYMIRGSLRDPFYMENVENVENTIEWLMYHRATSVLP